MSKLLSRIEFRVPAALAAVALLLAGPASASVVLNGGFEPAGPAAGYYALPGGSTTIPNWTTAETGVEWWDAGVNQSPEGGYAVDLANYVYSAGAIEQMIPTFPGEVVSVDFYLGTSTASGRAGTCEIEVSADGQTEIFTATHFGSPAQWFLKNFTFVADGPSAVLRFACYQNANQHFAFIDGVSLTVPVSVDATAWSQVKALYR